MGKDNAFHADSTNKKDFMNYGKINDKVTEQTRLDMVNDLRKSHLPTGTEQMPKSTANDSYKLNLSAEQKAMDMQQRNQEKQQIFDRVRGTKPNFRLGADKMTYQTEGSSNLILPNGMTYGGNNMMKE